ncbi:hypothetical protein FRD01_02565 [Microvenator marinus]|uniref:Zinc finger CHC2-type domain-containing protein n=1 Tax=Microvenator marinus TaxID=2600177 RepID=A0A5B8XRZ2_9DELT|nr:CHC2 zinc finger domain-containing protein [Microvenator marinus]QED26159.1 hypothetical protein FRD01_02565 [Microvenator marinus]
MDLSEKARREYGEMEDYLRSKGVELNRSGMACCPFHDDKNPSFSVKDDRWTCWAGCGNGGLIDLVAKFEGREPREICSELGKKYPSEGLRKNSKKSGSKQTPKPKAQAPTPKPKPKPEKLDHPHQNHPHFRGWRSTLLSRMLDYGIPLTEPYRGIPAELLQGLVYGFTAEDWDKARRAVIRDLRRYVPFDIQPLIPEAYRIANKVGDTWHRYQRFLVFPYWDTQYHFHPLTGNEEPWECFYDPSDEEEKRQYEYRTPYDPESSWRVRGLVELRFRNATEGAPKQARYTQTKLFGATRIPYLSNPVLLRLATQDVEAHKHTLYVCEGEWDTLSVWARGRVAIGIPGTSSWNDGWCKHWNRCGNVVVLSDPDNAGDELWQRIVAACVKTHGPRWTRKRLRRQFNEAGDINELLQRYQDGTDSEGNTHG